MCACDLRRRPNGESLDELCRHFRACQFGGVLRSQLRGQLP